jgi:hypothetical protein
VLFGVRRARRAAGIIKTCLSFVVVSYSHYIFYKLLTLGGNIAINWSAAVGKSWSETSAD